MKLNLVDTIVVVFIIALIGSTFFFYRKSSMGSRESVKLQYSLDSLSNRLREDSILITKLDDVNTNCSKSSLEKVKYYEQRINNLYRDVDHNRRVIDELQKKKDNISSDFGNTDILDYINKNY